jgi:hypothetical protein
LAAKHLAASAAELARATALEMATIVVVRATDQTADAASDATMLLVTAVDDLTVPPNCPSVQPYATQLGVTAL